MKFFLSGLLCASAMIFQSQSSQKIDKAILASEALLAEAFVYGSVEYIRPTDVSNSFGYFEIGVRQKDGLVKIYSDKRDLNEAVDARDKREKLFLTKAYQDGTTVAQILLSEPLVGIVDKAEAGAYVSNDSLARLKENARSFLQNGTKCDGDFQETILELGGSRQQAAIEKLFKHVPLSERQFRCLVSAIDSKDSVEVSSFRPPYGSRESTYHHHLPTVGDLISILLPHLAKIDFLPSQTPMTDVDRDKLKFAWGSWGIAHYALEQSRR